MKKLSKKELIKALEKAEKNPKDLGGIIGESFVVGLTGAGSAAIASTLLASTATTTVTAPVLGSTFLGGLVGARVLVTSIVAAPTLPVLAWTVGGIVVTHGLIKLVKSGSNNDKKRAEYVKALKEKISAYDKNIFNSTDKSIKMSKLAGIYVLLLKLDAVTTEGVETMFIGINNDSINIDFALTNAKSMLDSLQNPQNQPRLIVGKRKKRGQVL
jgi:hypothetical protein